MNSLSTFRLCRTESAAAQLKRRKKKPLKLRDFELGFKLIFQRRSKEERESLLLFQNPSMYNWQREETKEDEERSCVAESHVVTLGWAFHDDDDASTRRSAIPVGSFVFFVDSTSSRQHQYNDGRLVWKQEKKKKEYTFAWPVMYSSRAPVVCLFIIDTNVRARERTNGRTDNSVAATCVFIVAMATPHRSNQPNQIDYSPLSFGRSVGASTFDHIT